MKPFDLKAALDGAKLVRRDGVLVTKFRHGGLPKWPFEGIAHFRDGSPTKVTFGKDGRWSYTGLASEGDLFLADESSVRTKPFNLEAALKGEPVVTRDGRSVVDLKRFETVDKIYGVLAGYVSGWHLSGTYNSSGEHKADLFMAVPEPKMREIWLNLYPDSVYGYATEKNADQCAHTSTRIGKARRILIPEEEEA